MVSVCMATYNGERFIKEQIDSILCQLAAEDELIISDDGSTDKTLEVIESYGDNRIKVLHHKKNPDFAKIKYSRSFYYASNNFENAIKEAKGDYIFLSDQDDLWLSDKVKLMTESLQNADCVLCANNVIDSKNNLVTKYPAKDMFRKSVLYNLNRTPFLGCCMAFRKNALKYILPFPKKLIGHDLWIGCLCAYKNSLAYINKPLHSYRVHDLNVSPSVTGKSKNPFFFRIKYRVVFLFQIITRLFVFKIKK